MSAVKNALRVIMILPVLGLTACGEGYEMVPYQGTPYTMERTAGTGVQYVLAKMLPKKGVTTEITSTTKETEVKEIVDEEMPPRGEMGKKAADKVFNKKMKK